MFAEVPQHDDLHDAVPTGLPGRIGENSSDGDMQRAQGAGRIVLSGSANGTRVSEVYQQFPVRIMLPQIGDGAVREVVIVNVSGGIAGGDRLELEVIARD